MDIKYEIDYTKFANFPMRLTVTEDTVEIIKTDSTKSTGMGKFALQMMGISDTPYNDISIRYS